MTDKVVPIRAVAGDDGNTGNSGNTTTLAEPSVADDDRFAADIAHDLALDTLDTMEGDAEATVRVLLLAAAYLRAGAEMPENVHSVTTALLASLDEFAAASEDHPDGPLLLPMRKNRGNDDSAPPAAA